MDKIRELLERLNQLSADELAELRSLIITEFDRVDGDETVSITDRVALLNELAEAGEQAQAEDQGREQAQAEAEAARTAARERISALNGEEAEEETPETPEAAEGETPEAEAAPEGAPAEAVTAAGRQTGTVRRMAARNGRQAPSPEAGEPDRSRAVLTASGSLRGVDPNKPIEDRDTLATAMATTLQRMPRESASRGDVLLASASWSYPDDRKLGDDAWENARKLDAVTSLPALTASGGICLPVNVDYTVPTWATADRPLRDGLASFEASRGGVRYVSPPDIAALAGATGIWTEATDAAPGASTKPVISIACGTEQLVYVEAISTRIGFGNMQSRFAPEQVAANTDLAVAAASRIAENNLLNLIAAAAVSNVTASSTSNLGATRELLTAIYQGLAAYRSAHRIPREQTITAIFPDWVKDLLKIDLAREIGHQQDGSWNSLMITDAQVVELLRNTGINPIFHLDGQPSSVSGGVAQVFGIQATGTILTFPTKLVWYMFPEGQIQFLDGGRLDLGVVRDSTLDATNDYETFVETFEGVAFRGFANGAIQYVTTLAANGASAGTVNTTSDPA